MGTAGYFLISYHSVFFPITLYDQLTHPTRVYSKKGSRVFPNHLVRHLQRLHVIDLESPVIVTQKLERLYRHGDSYLTQVRDHFPNGYSLDRAFLLLPPVLLDWV